MTTDVRDAVAAPVWPIIEWAECYNLSWKGLITAESFSHPAKASRALITRIFAELLERDWLRKNDVVCDPFGGIGTTAIAGAYAGVQVICCELESKFVEFALANFKQNRTIWRGLGKPEPVIVQGDSRRLRANIANPLLALGVIDALVSSPPYADGALNDSQRTIHRSGLRTGDNEGDGGTYGETPGQLGALSAGDVDAVIGSPPYAEIASGAGGLNTKPSKHDGQQAGRSASAASQDTDQRYGDSAGQMAKMAAGDVDAIVSSPPFTQGYAGGGGINKRGYNPEGGEGADKVGDRSYQGTGAERSEGNLESLKIGEVDAVVGSPPYVSGGHHPDQTGAWNKNCRGQNKGGTGLGSKEAAGYGKSEGQIGQLNEGNINAVVSSPPYMGEGTPHRNGIDPDKLPAGVKRGGPNSQVRQHGYGDTEGQIGTIRSDETFWSAAHQVVRESYAILKPGGVAVWIVKAFVRNKKIVDFPGDWRRLCEHVGFEMVQEIHASLVSKTRLGHLFDPSGEVVKTRSRLSFFRRLAEKKGSPPIHHEVVLIMRKAEQ